MDCVGCGFAGNIWFFRAAHYATGEENILEIEPHRTARQQEEPAIYRRAGVSPLNNPDD